MPAMHYGFCRGAGLIAPRTRKLKCGGIEPHWRTALTATPTARLNVSRHAARLFLENGVAGTSGDDIAVAAGVSTRTIWRYFRSKESCVEPLFAASSSRFCAQLREWPRKMSIEDHLAASFEMSRASPDDTTDGILVARLVATLPQEPALLTAWLMSTYDCELELAEIIGDRLDLSANDFQVRLTAASVATALRVIDETISMAAINDGQIFTMADVVKQMAKAMREVSSLPFCDPIVLDAFGRQPRQSVPRDSTSPD